MAGAGGDVPRRRRPEPGGPRPPGRATTPRSEVRADAQADAASRHLVHGRERGIHRVTAGLLVGHVDALEAQLDVVGDAVADGEVDLAVRVAPDRVHVVAD